MTSVTDANVFNLAVRGTFDDGQAIVKTIFNDLEFKEKHQLGAVNSINWARIVAQVVYYIYAALKVTGSVGVGQVDFSVPTGNFGDIFAGYVARRMLPKQIRRLILATNENNLLTRFVVNGDYSLGAVAQTSSPSMDIQVASNFERYLYYLNGEDAERTRRDMERFAASGSLQFDDLAQERVLADFSSRSVNEEETIATIRDFYAQHGYVLDPHTAVGVKAGLAGREVGVPMICLATAHPAKFGAAVRRAIGHEPELPESLAGLADKESRCEVIAAEVGAVKAFVEQHAL
jgi:threonine synthase